MEPLTALLWALVSNLVFRFPKAQWKTLRTTNVIERLHEEFRRRVKTQRSLRSEHAAMILIFSLVARGRSSCAGSMAGRRSRSYSASKRR